MDLTGLEFPSLVIAIVANISLVIVVFRYAAKDQSRLFFTLFGLSQTIWITTNYYAIRSAPEDILNMARWTIASAVPHPVLFLLFIHCFAKKEKIRKWHIIPLVLLIGSFVWLARSNILFTHIEVINGQATPIAGQGMILFGVYAFLFVFWAFTHLVRSWVKSSGLERIQWRFIGIGLFLTFILVLTFNFIFAVVRDEIIYVNFGHIYTLPFVLFTAYAMIRHNLLNIKAFFAELAVILLNLILIVNLVNSADLAQYILNSVVIVSTIIVGILLVRSVRKEVEQRQKLQELTERLGVANEQLKALDKARAEFISIASHQLRTPPATIKWYLAAIVAGDFGRVTPKVIEAIKKTEITNNALISLIDDLLNVSRIERGKMEFLFEETDVVKLTQTAVDQLMPQASMKKLKLSLVNPKIKLPTIMADKEKLQQVVNNLIDNAIKYSKRGTIIVKLGSDPENILIRISDSGKGMSKEEMASIFDKYGRGKNSMQHAAGLGLGLYVARIVVEHHHGKILPESNGEGQGSSFLISLPIHTNLADEGELDLTKQ